MKRVAQIAVCMVVLLGLLGWVDTIATATAQTASVEVTADSVEVAVNPGEEIRKAFAETNPGEEIGKAIGEAMESGDLAHHALLIPILGIIGTIIMPVLMVPLVVW